MTDKEIIRGLECCIDGQCLGCPFDSKENQYCMHSLRTRTLDLIKRQQAEIEKARAEAIKEFADRFDDVLVGLRDEYAHFGKPVYGLVVEVVHHKLLKTVKEMIGDTDE